ncbi:MAG: Os1348 family NHLP clan protein [Chloroflexota bacterium]
MSIESVIKRIVDDQDYRELLLSNPDQALAEYVLTDKEREQLSNLDKDFLEAEDLEERISRWGRPAGSGI